MRADWPRALCSLLERSNSPVVRVAVVEVKGSAPRECGACMLVSREGIDGTIGGGNLEWEATQAAASLLSDSEGPAARVWSCVLGPDLSQCCGGAVRLWLERFTRADLPFLRNASRVIASGAPVVIASELSAARVTRRLVRADAVAAAESREAPVAASAEAAVSVSRDGRVGLSPESRVGAYHEGRVHFSHDIAGNAFLVERVDASAPALWLYGAGHVGQALIRAISDLPFEVTWVDPRAELLPAGLPDNIHALNAAQPVDSVTTAPSAALHLVMTHDHALDYSLCRAILARGEFAWLGLIGSKSKGAKFRSRLARDGVAAERIARLVCPIGVDGVGGKSPAAIAIAVAAQLLQVVGTVGRGEGDGESDSSTPAVNPCSSSDCIGCSSHNSDRHA